MFLGLIFAVNFQNGTTYLLSGIETLQIKKKNPLA